MKRIRLRSILVLIGLTLGVGLVLAAVFATQLGIDSNADWGPSRWFMLRAGLVLAGACLVWLLWHWFGRLLQTGASQARQGGVFATLQQAATAGAERWDAAVLSRPAILAARRSSGRALDRLRSWPRAAWLLGSSGRMAALAAVLVSLLVLAVYVWIVSVGRWTDWPTTTDHYEQLAEAFLHGQLHLRIEPDPRLLELTDPYQLEAREEVDYIWDLVLHNGRYYLYWGPVPAVLLAPIEALADVSPGDQVLVFVSMAAAFLAGVLLSLTIWRRFFSRLPWWSAALPLGVLGLANPMPWLLNRPAVYEVAIGAGQAFLLLGTTFALTALYGRAPARGRLTAAGICWVAAVGSRASLAVAVGFLAGATALGIWFSVKPSRRLDLGSLTAIFLPLALGAALLAGYNAARFGSPLEFGHRFQLSSLNMNRQYERIFSVDYAAANVYNYLVNPMRRLAVFPFVKPTWAARLVVPLHLYAPDSYGSEQTTGVLVTTPFTLYAVVALVLSVRRTRDGASESLPPTGPNRQPGASLGLTQAMLAGGVLCAALPLVTFSHITQRYLADFVPLLVILATVGFWQAHRSLAARSSVRRLHLLIAGCLMAYSAAIGLLLAVTGYQARFEHLNPLLFEQITRLLAF